MRVLPPTPVPLPGPSISYFDGHHTFESLTTGCNVPILTSFPPALFTNRQGYSWSPGTAQQLLSDQTIKRKYENAKGAHLLSDVVMGGSSPEVAVHSRSGRVGPCAAPVVVASAAAACLGAAAEAGKGLAAVAVTKAANGHVSMKFS